jgi:hypothetical protein
LLSLFRVTQFLFVNPEPGSQTDERGSEETTKHHHEPGSE